MSFRNSWLFKHLARSWISTKTRECCTRSTESALFTNLSPVVEDTEDKVTIIGAGKVGVACAFTILSQGISRSVILLDKNEKLLLGETLDLQHGSLFLKTSNLEAATNYRKTANSRITILAAGVRRESSEETRFSLAQKNVEIFKEVIPEIIKHSPNTILLVITNPVDIMTWVAWKMSGLPLYSVIGSGTNVDSARFRLLISERFELPAESCRAYIIGEHDKNLIAAWSTVNIEGVKIRDLNPKAALDGDPENWKSVEERVVQTAEELIKLKGYTCWATAMSVGLIVDQILSNINAIATVSTNANGHHGVDFDVFLSLPCILNANGLHKIVRQTLQKDERDMFLKTAQNHKKLMEKLDLDKCRC